MPLSVTETDVSNAEDFIVALLDDRGTDGDYTDGALLRDLAVKGIAYIVAYLRTTNDQILARQSLKSILEVDVTDDPDAADDAADAVISNWFGSRNLGTYARVTAFGTSVERVDIDIPADARFYKTASLPFILDNSGDDLHIPAETLTAQFDSSGEVSGYSFRFPLVSEEPGGDYNIEPGVFTTWDDFNANVSVVETLDKAISGDDKEVTEDFISRSENLITVRNLINARSCDAVIRDEYEDIRTVSVIGMGDLEMVRDRVTEAATGFDMHVGGHQDIFLSAAIQETSFTGTVGAKFTRPDGVINVFRDATYADWDGSTGHKFTEADPTTGKMLQAGMGLRIWEGLPLNARDFIIREVLDTELIISEKVPFPIATDEDSTYVTWSVGHEMPSYVDVVPQQTTGETSRQIQHEGMITLPGGPVYHISEVTLDDADDPDADPSTGLVEFNIRSNVAPTVQTAPDNEYQLIVHNPESHQSTQSFAEIFVGVPGDLDKYDGKTLKVTYQTITGFSTVDTFVSSQRQRVSAANPLTRAFHPAYLGFNMEYRLKVGETDAIDEDEALDVLLEYINDFPPDQIIDVSQIGDYFKANFPTVSHVYPFVISYLLHTPDGRVIAFETTEAVAVPLVETEREALLLNPDSEDDGLSNPLDLGITDDVIRYLALRDDLSITQRAA